MKNKKLVLPSIIIIVAILAIVAYTLIGNIAKKPVITEGEFPFSITYELDGETITIDDVYKVRYERNDGYADTKTRVYVGKIGNREEGDTSYTIKDYGQMKGYLCLYTYFHPEYMMGDSQEYSYFDEDPFAPEIYYYDAEGQSYGDEETLAAHKVKLVSFEYPEPIENSFVFSHISYSSGEVVLPALGIALLAMLAILIFVKKEADLKYSILDKITFLLNVLVFIFLVPFLAFVGMFIDINGGGPDLLRQILYYFSAFTVLAIAASVALRRKGYSKSSLIATLVGPATFAVYYVVCMITELL